MTLEVLLWPFCEKTVILTTTKIKISAISRGDEIFDGSKIELPKTVRTIVHAMHNELTVTANRNITEFFVGNLE